MRVLCVRLSAMGDVVHTLGAVEALALALPTAEISYVTQRENAPLFEHLPFSIDVIEHDRRGGWRSYLRTGGELRRGGFDVALDLQGNWKSAGLTRWSGAARRIGMAAELRREPSSAVCLTERVGDPAANHPFRAALACVRRIAPDAGDTPSRVHATREEVEAERVALAACGIDPNARFDVFVVGDPADCRTWPIEAMRRQASSHPVPIVWLRGPSERQAPVPGGVTVVTHGAGSVRRLVALGTLCREVGGTVLGPDQGATHVLAATGVRSIAMFGPQDPERTAPLAATVRQRADGPDCVPCRSRACRHEAGPICMDFTVELEA